MTCGNCGHDNRESATFCEECGSSLARVCPNCQAEVRESARFCDSCGQRLAETDPISPSPANLAVASGQPIAPSAEIRARPDPDTNRGEGTTFANGRYQAKRFLGERGKKRVYLSHDTPMDREVAFALIKTTGLDDTSRARIQRPKPWAASVPTRTSSPFSTWAKIRNSPTW